MIAPFIQAQGNPLFRDVPHSRRGGRDVLDKFVNLLDRQIPRTHTAPLSMSAPARFSGHANGLSGRIEE